MAEKTGREYLAKLDAAVKKCDEDQDLNAYFGLLETIFDGVKDNVMIEIPFDVDFKNYVIIDEYDEVISYNDFIEMVERKQEQFKDNPDNFTYNRNVNGYRFDDREFC